MGNYLIRRLLWVPLTVLGVVTIVFFSVHLVPGDPAAMILGEYATDEAVATLRHQLGLDRPLLVQYVGYIGRILTGDLGHSLRTKQLVLGEILRVFPATLELSVASIVVAVLFGIPVGMVAALRRNTWLDYGVMGLAMVGVSMPIFFFAMLLILGLAYHANLFPILGAGEQGNLLSRLHHLVLPSLTIGVTLSALVARMTRSSVLEVLGQDYMRTAMAKGLAHSRVVYKHGLRNALIPLVTILGVNMGNLLGGTVITESVFSRPGLGRLLLDAISARDYPQIQGAVAFFAFFFVAINLVTDLMYGFIDPRIRYQ